MFDSFAFDLDEPDLTDEKMRELTAFLDELRRTPPFSADDARRLRL